ncbi:hypothetical protein [Arthrobacter sp. KK5.5]|uniref:hypothetical protein n=1 Tax=Arthrobacter sp. KK5.5 TaxID=3373084 RepID=UPI003EE668FE
MDLAAVAAELYGSMPGGFVAARTRELERTARKSQGATRDLEATAKESNRARRLLDDARVQARETQREADAVERRAEWAASPSSAPSGAAS